MQISPEESFVDQVIKAMSQFVVGRGCGEKVIEFSVQTIKKIVGDCLNTFLEKVEILFREKTLYLDIMFVRIERGEEKIIFVFKVCPAVKKPLSSC
jgi:hypothetical protein